LNRVFTCYLRICISSFSLFIHCTCSSFFYFFFFFNDPATTEIYTLSLHDALPICVQVHHTDSRLYREHLEDHFEKASGTDGADRSEEHTSELQSRFDLVCRLLLEKKKKNKNRKINFKQHIRNYDMINKNTTSIESQ